MPAAAASGTVTAAPAVLITGASKGIGEACMLRLVAAGFRVYAGVRSVAAGAAVQRRGGAAVEPVILDVTDPDQIHAAVARIRDGTRDHGLHAVINNAGIAAAGPMEFLPVDELRRQLEVNFVGQIAVTQACLPLLRRAREVAGRDARNAGPNVRGAGRTIFMSSVSGRSALPFIGAYAASKFALEAAADALRVELRPFGLDVVLIEPGVITTPIWETSARAAEHSVSRMPAASEQYYGRTAAALLERVARGMHGLPPERVADVVLRALTARRPRARYVVGIDARARITLEALLPDRVRDWIIAQVLRRL